MKTRRLISAVKIEKKKYFTKRFFGWSVLGLLVAIQIFFAIQASTLGAELSVLEHESMEIVKTNEGLKTSVVTKLSLSDAEDKANALGFEKSAKVVFVKRDDKATALR